MEAALFTLSGYYMLVGAILLLLARVPTMFARRLCTVIALHHAFMACKGAYEANRAWIIGNPWWDIAIHAAFLIAYAGYLLVSARKSRTPPPIIELQSAPEWPPKHINETRTSTPKANKNIRKFKGYQLRVTLREQGVGSSNLPTPTIYFNELEKAAEITVLITVRKWPSHTFNLEIYPIRFRSNQRTKFTTKAYQIAAARLSLGASACEATL
jgi:hypothetical protein